MTETSFLYTLLLKIVIFLQIVLSVSMVGIVRMLGEENRHTHREFREESVETVNVSVTL